MVTPAARPTIVLTGASGFIGRRLCGALAAGAAGGRNAHVVALARDAERVRRLPGWRPEWQVRPVSLDSPIDADVIPQQSVVVHLAAATGRASPARMHATNVDGTRRLVAAAVAAGVTHFVFMSSIAARYGDARWYPYAVAKREAEALLAGGGVPYSIVRPTIVFGPGSPAQDALTKLAVSPLPVLFGSGAVRVQPVHRDDVITVLIALVDATPAGGSVLEVGGADCLTMDRLLAAIRRSRGLGERRFLRIPLLPLRVVLAGLEPLLRPLLPVTAGQLAVFANDSHATPNDRVRDLLPRPLGLDAMLATESSRA